MSYLQSKLPEFSPAVVIEPWRKALMDAAEYIRVHGHCKGRLWDNEGRVCFYGAIRRGMGHPASHPVAPISSDFYAQKAGFKNSGEAVDWNNAPGRTAAEVIAALEAAARS